MSISVDQIYNQANTANTESLYEANDELDKMAFLNMLVTQLKYQDPLNPMEDKEFVAQMAQFSSLEQLQNLNSSFEDMMTLQGLGEVSGLIGKEVTAIVAETDDGYYTGTVESAVLIDGEFKVLVDDYAIPVENILKITPVAAETTDTAETTESTESES